MSRPVRLFLASWLIALYGLISLCGMGLHSLADTTFTHHNHASGGHGDEPSKSLASDTDDCPLCNFQSQGQWHVTFVPEFSCPLDQPHLPSVSAPIGTRAPSSTGSPRAPPINASLLGLGTLAFQAHQMDELLLLAP